MSRMGGYVPTDHKTRHQDGGRDELSIASLSGTPAELTTHAALTIAHGTVDDIADQADIAAHAADLDAHTYNILELLRTGEYYTSIATSSVTGTLNAVANTLYAIPLWVARKITIDRMTINVTTLADGKVVRLGIYNNGVNLYPGTLLLDAGTVSTSTTGHKVITGLSQALTKGLYWLVALSDGTPTLRNFSSADFLWPILGQWVSAPDYASSNWTVTQAYGALPSTFTAGGSAGPGDKAPRILVRVASLD